MSNVDEIEVVDLEEYLLSQGINPYLDKKQDDVEVVDLEQFLLAQGINPYFQQDSIEDKITLEEITLDNGSKKYVDHDSFVEYHNEKLKQARIKRQEAARYREIITSETKVPKVILEKQGQAEKTSNELSNTLDELRKIIETMPADSSTIEHSNETKKLPVEKAKLYKYINLDGSISLVTEDEFNERILENVVQVKRNNRDLRNRRLKRVGKLARQESCEETKSSREVAREMLSKMKQAIDDEFKMKKEETANKQDLTLTPQGLMIDNKLNSQNVSLEDLSEIAKEIKANNPLTKYEETHSNSEEKKEHNKRTKHKKFSFKRLAIAASLILGVILPGKNANKYDTPVVKNITIQEQTNKDNTRKVQTNNETEITRNDNGNKVVINHKVIKKTLKNNIKLKNRVTLRNATFHYSSTGIEPKVSQSSLPCDSYKITKIAILSSGDNEIIDTIDVNENNKNMSIDDLKTNIKSVYGDDIKIKVNVNGIEDGKEAYKNIGWTSINKVSDTAKVYSKKK